MNNMSKLEKTKCPAPDSEAWDKMGTKQKKECSEKNRIQYTSKHVSLNTTSVIIYAVIWVLCWTLASLIFEEWLSNIEGYGIWALIIVLILLIFGLATLLLWVDKNKDKYGKVSAI